MNEEKEIEERNIIKIMVVSDDGVQLQDVTVILFRPDLTSEPHFSITDNNGVAIFKQIPTGTYSVKAILKGFEQTVIESIAIKPRKSQKFKIILKTSPIMEEIVFDNYIKVPVFYGTNRKKNLSNNLREFYGAKRGKLQLGQCWVSIPKDHKMGRIETPNIFRFESRGNPKKHIVLLEINPLSKESFFKELKLNVRESIDKEAFVFIHGFNTTFEQASQRTAQFAYDLGLEIPIMFSWPSKGELSIFGYTHDENNIQWTVPALKFFLKEVSKQSGASRIHLIAHSMGNRALTDALRSITMEMKISTKPVFNEIILTAADIDADIFKDIIAPQIINSGKRITLYASSFDKALIFSKRIHGYQRVGDAGHKIVVVKGIDTIDVSPLETDFFGHTYFANNRNVINDLFMLLKQSLPPKKRNLTRKRMSIGDYWIFKK